MLKSRLCLTAVGHLAKDAQLKTVESKKNAQVINVPIIINSYYKTKNSEKVEESETYFVEMWYPAGKNLEPILKMLKKGAFCWVEGKPIFSPYIDTEGNAACLQRMNADAFDVYKFAKDGTKIEPSEPISQPDPSLSDDSDDHFPIPDSTLAAG